MSEDLVRGMKKPLTDAEEAVLAKIAERGRIPVGATGFAGALPSLFREGLVQADHRDQLRPQWVLTPRGSRVATVLAQREATRR